MAAYTDGAEGTIGRMDKFLSEDHRCGQASNRTQLNQPATEIGPLALIEERIEHFRMNIHNIAARLEDHALKVHGPFPEEASNIRGPTSEAVGALPKIYVALDDLNHAIDRLALASGMNTTLA